MRSNPETEATPYNATKNVCIALLLMLYVVFISGFYHLVIRPLTLDYSFLGFVVLGALVLLSYYAFPKRVRMYFTLLTLMILLVGYAVDRIYSDSIGWRFLEFPLLFLIIGGVSLRLGRIKWRHTLVVLLAIGILETFIPLSQIDYYEHFVVSENSGTLDRSALLPFYPISKNGSQLFTLGELPATSKQQQKDLADLNKQKKLMDPDVFNAALIENTKQKKQQVDVLKLDSDHVNEPMPTTPQEFAKLPFGELPLAGVPSYESIWTVAEDGHVQQKFTPVASPEEFLNNFFNPLAIPIRNHQMIADAYDKSKQNWSQFTGQHVSSLVTNGIVIGKGRLLPGQGNKQQVLVESDNRLSIFAEPLQANAKPIVTLKGTWSAPFSSEILIADIDKDGQDELLCNTSPAQILKVQKDGTWKLMWRSAKESFRFEFVHQDGKSPVIVANDPSIMRDQPLRYLSGYTWDGKTLSRDWRVFKSNNIHPFELSPSKWIAQIYDTHQFLVLKPITYNIQLIFISVYLFLLALGFGSQPIERRKLK